MRTIVSLLWVAGIVWAWVKCFQEGARFSSHRAELDGVDVAWDLVGGADVDSWVSGVGAEGGAVVCPMGEVDVTCSGSGEVLTYSGGGLEGDCFDWLDCF
jgi:hypothetical protein